MASSTLATVGILSVGEMGMGIAKLLVANGFSVATNCAGRRYVLYHNIHKEGGGANTLQNSKDTIERVKAAQVQDLATDTALVKECDVILSVVPPRDAQATAQRLLDALALVTRGRRPNNNNNTPPPPLYFADLNAVSPHTIQAIARRILKQQEEDAAGGGGGGPSIALIDGAILGEPPHLTTTTTTTGEWKLPRIPTSGPVRVADIPGYGAQLAAALRVQHVGPEIGAASGLKACFASLTKGYAAIAVQSFTTAQRMGVFPALQDALRDLVPQQLAHAEKALTGMPPKAYRWVREMEEIARTHAEQGGFDEDLFKGAAGVFKAVAEDTVLGQEKIGERKRGRTGEDVAVAMAEGLECKRKKLD